LCLNQGVGMVFSRTRYGGWHGFAFDSARLLNFNTLTVIFSIIECNEAVILLCSDLVEKTRKESNLHAV
jgi:hypothetical protein